MALRSVVHKADLRIADLGRAHYADYALTVARHPSETEERMMMRLLAFAMHARERLEFGRGLSTDDEPDLWRRDLTGAIELWIDVGLPDARLVRKAAGRAREGVVVSYVYFASSCLPRWPRQPSAKRVYLACSSMPGM